MSEIKRVPIAELLGDPNGSVKSEESWSKFLPTDAGAAAPVREFNREKAIQEAIKRPSERRTLKSVVPAGNVASILPPRQMQVIREEPAVFHFFVVKGKRIELIGSGECPIEKFERDLSGRFFREWLKKSFPGRKDYDDICVWNDLTPLKEITELLEMMA